MTSRVRPDSASPRGNNVVVNEEFQGSGGGYAVALSNSATFPPARASLIKISTDCSGK